jgi:hypothetical protein
MKHKSGQWDDQSNNKAKPPQEKKLARGFLSLGHAFFEKYKADKYKDQKSKEIDSSWIRHGATAAIIYTAITFVIMVVGGYQVFVSRDTERRQLRAYLGVSKIEMHCCALPDIEQGITREIRKVITVVIKNGGQTPASDVRLRGGQFEYPFDSLFPANLDFDMPISNARPTAAPQTEGSEYLLPGEEKPFSIPAAALAIMRTQERLSRVIIYGHVEGTDVFGDRHVTDFCKIYSFDFDGTENFTGCPGHNGERY